MDVSFYGVRGSCPCASEATRRYGGNTACVVLTVPGEAPIILDLGTGLRAFGLTQPTDGTFQASALVTHLHWDHVQGLPFFPPVDRPGARLAVYGPAPADTSLAEAFADLVRPPYFPVRLADLRGEISYHDVPSGAAFDLGRARATVRTIPHVGPTVGYRVEWDGASVAYVSDHQAPGGPGGVVGDVDAGVLELAAGVDVLVHDAQYTSEEFGEKSHWGHSTIDYAVEVARRAGAATLVLFHHDPGHADDLIDRLVLEARSRAGESAPAIVAASEGLVLRL